MRPRREAVAISPFVVGVIGGKRVLSIYLLLLSKISVRMTGLRKQWQQASPLDDQEPLLAVSHTRHPFPSMIFQALMQCTANLLTAKTTGIHCVTFPTAVSLHFLQLATACSGTLQLHSKTVKTCKLYSEIAARFVN